MRIIHLAVHESLSGTQMTCRYQVRTVQQNLKDTYFYFYLENSNVHTYVTSWPASGPNKMMQPVTYLRYVVSMNIFSESSLKRHCRQPLQLQTTSTIGIG